MRPIFPLLLTVSAVVSACCAAALSGCSERAPAPQPITLYVSADDHVVRPVVQAFEKETGFSVLVRGDTEATKTTGLVQRLRAEKERPRADVFWSSEVFLTITLADQGILASTPALVPPQWPTRLVGVDARWIGFAQRARVCVYNIDRVAAEDTPQSLHDLLEPRFRGRIVIARPAFGTTRGHLAALVTMWGEDAARQWMIRLGDQNIRFLDGNSSVVRAVAAGEADIGLTDTDDVWAGRRMGWPIAMTYIRHDRPPSGPAEAGADHGPLVIPNTVSIVAGAPNPAGAKALARFLLSERVERMLAESDSRNLPVRPTLQAEFQDLAVPDASATPFDAITRQMPRAMELAREEWGQ